MRRLTAISLLLFLASGGACFENAGDSDGTVNAACEDCGLLTPCAGLNGCQYNGNSCEQTSNEGSCPNLMQGLSQFLCNSNPGQCGDLNGVFQWMGGNWSGGSACGALNNSWCVSGNDYQDLDALCVSQ